MKFSVPALGIISGWIEVEADSLAQAKVKCNLLNETGIDTDQLNDPNYDSVVYTDECLPIDEEVPDVEPITLRMGWSEPDNETD